MGLGTHVLEGEGDVFSKKKKQEHLLAEASRFN
jgi:hypothetical protein